MIQFAAWPPPHWTEVVITWDQILENKRLSPNMLYEWCSNQPGGMFHVHGWENTKGFAFRFEQPKDATMFALVWADQ